MNEWMNEWMDGWMNEWMNEVTLSQNCCRGTVQKLSSKMALSVSDEMNVCSIQVLIFPTFCRYATWVMCIFLYLITTLLLQLCKTTELLCTCKWMCKIHCAEQFKRHVETGQTSTLVNRIYCRIGHVNLLL